MQHPKVCAREEKNANEHRTFMERVAIEFRSSRSQLFNERVHLTDHPLIRSWRSHTLVYIQLNSFQLCAHFPDGRSSSPPPTHIQFEHTECRNAQRRRRDPLRNGVSKTKHVTRFKFLIQFLIWTYNFAAGFVVSICVVKANKRKTKTELLHAHTK